MHYTMHSIHQYMFLFIIYIHLPIVGTLENKCFYSSIIHPVILIKTAKVNPLLRYYVVILYFFITVLLISPYSFH